MDDQATGKVKQCLGNLINVEFKGDIKLGEVGFVELENEKLKAEVIEIEGNNAKMQVFEDTDGVCLGTPVSFSGELLSVELGPGILKEIFDGLQNPLEKVADQSGLFLQKGSYIEALDRVKTWHFTQTAKVGDLVKRGDPLGSVPEGRFKHLIMVPFSHYETYRVKWLAQEGSYTVDQVIAKLEDDKGNEIPVTMVQNWPIKFPLREGKVVQADKHLTTGLRVVDTLIPMVKGGKVISPGPFGSGKTVTQHTIAKYSNVDIVVVAACGERAGEVVEVLIEFPTLVDVHTGDSLMERMAIICNTSSMPVAARESSVYVGITIAEYYRQMGLDVLLLADSTSRWAQAMREMSGRLEEIPGEEAFPAYLQTRIFEFYERAGALEVQQDEVGSVSIVGAVSPAGGSFLEPVTQASINVAGGFLCLSRELSDKRHYPAIDAMQSWSKYVDRVGESLSQEVPKWREWVDQTRKLLLEGEEIATRMEVVGQEGTTIDDFITYLKAELFSFCYLQQNAFEKEDAYCSMEQQMRQFALVNRIFEIPFSFSDPDEAKSYFLSLQNEIRDLNYIKFGTEQYDKSFKAVEEKLDQVETAGV